MNLLDKTFALNQLEEIASLFLEMLPESKIITFEGELGAGKTTLIAEICKCLHVNDAVGSPTFSIINEYKGMLHGHSIRIFHVDLYRLTDEEEARQVGIEDCLYGDGIAFVEWPSKVPSIIPDDALHVELSHMNEGYRHILVRTEKND